jgi:multidrug efflux pump subunit AcrA (membrane-fusion protein)
MKRMWVIWVLLASIAAGAALLQAVRSNATAQEASTSSTAQSVARLGSLSVSISGAGELVSTSTAELKFEQSGVLQEVFVKAGDAVQSGDILAQLQIDQSPAEYAGEIAAVKLAVLKAQQAYDELFANAQLERAQALVAVEEAEWALEDLQHIELEVALAQQAVAEAQEAIESAEMDEYIANSSPSEEAIYTAYASLLFKEKKLKEVEKQIAQTQNRIKSAQDDMMRRMLQRQVMNLNVQVAELRGDYENALYRYNTMNDPADPVELSHAQVQLATAKEQLKQAQLEFDAILKSPSAGEVAAAEAALSEARLNWEQLKDGPDPVDMAEAETQLTIAQAQLAELEEQSLVVDLVATLDGAVLEVNAAAGDRVGIETIITLADLSQPAVEVYLDEVDLEGIEIGSSTSIVFDVLPDITFSGQVILVDPSLVDVGNTNSVRAVVALDDPALIVEGKLPLGLNASVDIVSGSVDQAVLIPLEALHQSTDGYSVYILEGTNIQQRSVTIGLMDATTAAVLDGLEPGEIVLTGDVETSEGEQ